MIGSVESYALPLGQSCYEGDREFLLARPGLIPIPLARVVGACGFQRGKCRPTGKTVNNCGVTVKGVGVGVGVCCSPWQQETSTTHIELLFNNHLGGNARGQD